MRRERNIMTESALTLESQYLTFMLGKECFALDITSIREVLEFSSSTAIPNMPEYMRGLINIRGRAIPVIDLKTKLAMGQTGQSVNTCVIITEIKGKNQTLLIGALVDAVEEVFDLDPKDIEPAPQIGNKIDTAFIKGIGKSGEHFMILLDIDEMFKESQIHAVDATS
jgi:purine-binding chemotaxis protein CheW